MKIIRNKKVVYGILLMILCVYLFELKSFTNYLVIQQGMKLLQLLAYFVYTFFVIKMRYKNSSINIFHYALITFGILLSCYAIFSEHISMLFPCLNVLLIYFFFFYTTKNNIITNKVMKYFSLCFVFVAGVLFIDNLLFIFSYRDSLAEAGGMNIGYTLFAAMLLVLLFYSEKKYFVLIICLFIAILFSLKRGAVLCGGVVLLGVTYCAFKEYSLKIKLLLIGSGILGIFIVNSYFVDIPNIVFHRFTEGSLQSGSGRSVIYSTILNDFMQAGIIQMLFGRGFFAAGDMNYDGTIYGEGYYAHSDLYELICDHGMIGMVCYIFLLLSVLFLGYNRKYLCDKNILFIILSVWMLKAYFAGVYTTLQSQTIFMALGFLNGKYIREINMRYLY